MGITDRSSKELLTFTDVCFAYDNVPSLVHVTFTIHRGDTVAILGPNGAGKSTLLSLLNGIHFPETGRYLFEGTEITAEKMREHRYSKWFHQRVGFIWQDPGAMLFCPTVEEELAFGPQQMGLDETLVQERVKDALGFFNIAHLCGRAPYTLSGGEKRRVAMAAIFTVNPAVWRRAKPSPFPRTTRHLHTALLRRFFTFIKIIRLPLKICERCKKAVLCLQVAASRGRLFACQCFCFSFPGPSLAMATFVSSNVFMSLSTERAASTMRAPAQAVMPGSVSPRFVSVPSRCRRYGRTSGARRSV